MTKEELATKLEALHLQRGQSMRISRGLAEQARASGLVYIYGESDDKLEFRGAIYDEVGAYKGVDVAIFQHDNHWHAVNADALHDLQEPWKLMGATTAIEKKALVQAIWCSASNETVWYIDTLLPHARFNIYTRNIDNLPETNFCMGIVLDVRDLKRGLLPEGKKMRFSVEVLSTNANPCDVCQLTSMAVGKLGIDMWGVDVAIESEGKFTYTTDAGSSIDLTYKFE